MASRGRRQAAKRQEEYDTYSSDTDYYSENEDRRKACIKRTRFVFFDTVLAA